jgi:hypothetical protein
MVPSSAITSDARAALGFSRVSMDGIEPIMRKFTSRINNRKIPVSDKTVIHNILTDFFILALNV